MSKKLFIIFVLIILVVAGVFGWYFFMSGGTTTESGEVAENSDDNLFPFGQNANNGQSGSTTVTPIAPLTNTGEINNATGLPRLRQLSTIPTASVVAFDVASTTMIRYIEKATGHIFETPSGKSQVQKISSVTMPKIYEALWSMDGNRVVIRYLNNQETIKTFSAKIDAKALPENALEGSFLADNIRDITASGTKLYYTNETGTGSNGISSNMDGGGKVSVFTSSFSDWVSRYSASGNVTISSRPSGLVSGAVYSLNLKTGSYAKISTDALGFTGIGNNDDTLFLMSYTEEGSLRTGVYNTKTATFEKLGISTISDKCVWSKKERTIVYCAVPILPARGVYPDVWYKGKVSFTDSLWKVDVMKGETTEILNSLSESGISIDMIDLGLNQSESVLTFRNKKDQFAWRYELVK